MPKQNDTTIVTSDIGDAVLCAGCGSPRFQVHERGQLVRYGDTITVSVNELAIQCLDCHRVEIVPVNGHVEYYA